MNYRQSRRVLSSEMANAKTVAISSLAILIALLVVGAVSIPPGSLRHEVQTRSGSRLSLAFRIGS
jgi:hypothetical protein